MLYIGFALTQFCNRRKHTMKDTESRARSTAAGKKGDDSDGIISSPIHQSIHKLTFTPYQQVCLVEPHGVIKIVLRLLTMSRVLRLHNAKHGVVAQLADQRVTVQLRQAIHDRQAHGHTRIAEVDLGRQRHLPKHRLLAHQPPQVAPRCLRRQPHQLR
jgi:hypothetical protein